SGCWLRRSAAGGGARPSRDVFAGSFSYRASVAPSPACGGGLGWGRSSRRELGAAHLAPPSQPSPASGGRGKEQDAFVKMRKPILTLFLAGASLCTPLLQAACLSESTSREALQTLKTRQFAVDD